MAYAVSAMANVKEENFDFTSNSLIILTAAGTIYGTPCFSLSNDNAQDTVSNVIYEQAKQMTSSDAPQYSIILKNATLITSGGIKYSFDTLFVFPDDVIAITIGDTSHL